MSSYDNRPFALPPRAILFDFDGTLLNSFPAHFKAYQITFQRLGRSITQEEFLQSYSPNWYHTYKSMGLPRELWSRADDHWLEAASTLEPELFPNVPEILNRCKLTFSVGLVTSGSGSRVKRDLRRTGIEKLFSVIVTGDDVQVPKPSPDGLFLAMEKLKIRPDETVYVGDAQADFEMARAAGVPFVGVASEFSAFGKDPPFELLKSIDGILPLLFHPTSGS